MDRLPRAVVWSPYLAALPLTRKGMRPELSPVRSGGGAADRCAETSDRSLAGEPPAARRAQGRGDGNSTVARRQGDRKAQKEPTLTVATRPTTSADHGLALPTERYIDRPAKRSRLTTVGDMSGRAAPPGGFMGDPKYFMIWACECASRLLRS